MGKGTPIDDHKAAQFCRKAGKQVHAHANLCLAHMYHHGRGVKQNNGKGFLCYQKALAIGLENPEIEAETKTRLADVIEAIEREIDEDLK